MGFEEDSEPVGDAPEDAVQAAVPEPERPEFVLEPTPAFQASEPQETQQDSPATFSSGLQARWEPATSPAPEQPQASDEEDEELRALERELEELERAEQAETAAGQGGADEPEPEKPAGADNPFKVLARDLDGETSTDKSAPSGDDTATPRTVASSG